MARYRPDEIGLEIWPCPLHTRGISWMGHIRPRAFLDPESRAGHGQWPHGSIDGWHTHTTTHSLKGQTSCPTRLIFRLSASSVASAGHGTFRQGPIVRKADWEPPALQPSQPPSGPPEYGRCAMESQRCAGPRVLETPATTRRGPGRLKPGVPHPTAWPWPEVAAAPSNMPSYMPWLDGQIWIALAQPGVIWTLSTSSSGHTLTPLPKFPRCQRPRRGGKPNCP